MFRRKSSQTPIGRRHLDSQSSSKKTSPFAYYSSRRTESDQAGRDKPKGPEPRIKEPSLAWNHIYTVVIVIVVVIVLFDILWVSSTPKVVVIDNSSSQVLLQNSSVYEQATENILKSSFLNHDKVTINIASITSALEAKFPELASVSLTLPITGHQPTLYIQPNQPVLLFDNGSNIYAVASNGMALGVENQQNTGALNKINLPIVHGIGIPSKVDEQVLSSDDVSFITYIERQLATQNIVVSQMNIIPNSREIDVTMVGQSFSVKFNFESDVKQQVGTYLSVRDYLATNKITPAQYIDVRVLGRAYYK